MEKFNFGGVQTQVLALSPRNSYFLFRLSIGFAVKGIYTGDFIWDEQSDNLRGFLPDQFTLYLGASSIEHAVDIIKPMLIQAGARSPVGTRRAKWVDSQSYPYEVKAIGIAPEKILSILTSASL